MSACKLVIVSLLELASVGCWSCWAQVGVPPGIALKKYDGTYTVTQDGAVISNLEVHGNIIVEASNVTLKNVRLISKAPWHALQLAEKSSGFILQDSEIDGAGTTVNAVYGFGSFLRNDIHDAENGINVIGPSVIRDNVIHSLRGGPNAHFDGIEINGGKDIDIAGNVISNTNGQTSAIMLDNYFSGLSNIKIRNNRLVGGGYTVYLDGRFDGGAVDDRSISITGNRIGGGTWGNFALYGHEPLLKGNTDLDGVSPLQR